MNMSTEYEKVDTTGKMSYEKIMKAERSADIFRHLYLYLIINWRTGLRKNIPIISIDDNICPSHFSLLHLIQLIHIQRLL